MKVIQYLKENSLEQLAEKFSISVNRHQEFPNLVQLKYSQLKSPMKEELVWECRGLILDEARDWAVVAYPFKRFFNHGSFYASEIDWETARVYEKLDGSLMTLYHYENEWHIASASLPNAGGEIRGTDLTLGELFWRIWTALGYNLPQNTEYCYIFEMTSPLNQVVVRQTDSHLYLLGARKLSDLSEVFPEEIEGQNWAVAPSFPIRSIEEALAGTKAMNPMEQEGFVICDSQFNRVKLKSPQYVSIGHLRGIDGDNVKRCLLQIVRTNEGNEFLLYKPEYKEKYEQIKAKFDALVKELEEHFEAVKNIEDRKEFGLKCKNTKFPGLFFQLKQGRILSVKSFLYNISIRKLEKVI